MKPGFKKDWQYYKFCLYGFLKNQRFFDPFLILFFREKGLTYTQIGTLYSLRFIIRAILEIPSGMFADALGRKGTMLVSYGLYIVSFPAYYFSSDFTWLLIPTVIFAIGDAFRTGTHKAMIFDYLKHKGWSNYKTHYYGHTRSWSQAGSAISSLLAALAVILSGNYSSIFLFSIIPYIIGFTLLATYPTFLNGPETRKNKHTTGRVFEVFLATFKSVNNKSEIRNLLGISIHSGYFMAMKDYIQPILKSLALSLPVFITLAEKERTAMIVGPIYFILYLLTSAASRSAGRVDSRIGSPVKTLNYLMCVGFSIGLIAALGEFMNITILAVLMFIGIQVIENIRRPSAVSFIAERFDDKITASVLSVESQLHSIIAAIIAFSVGLIIQYLSLAYAIAIITLVSFGFSIMLRNTNTHD